MSAMLGTSMLTQLLGERRKLIFGGILTAAALGNATLFCLPAPAVEKASEDMVRNALLPCHNTHHTHTTHTQHIYHTQHTHTTHNTTHTYTHTSFLPLRACFCAYVCCFTFRLQATHRENPPPSTHNRPISRSRSRSQRCRRCWLGAGAAAGWSSASCTTASAPPSPPELSRLTWRLGRSDRPG